MAGVDKFGAAFAVAFMVAMIAFMGSLSPDGDLPGISIPETSTPTSTPTPPAQISPPETVTTPSTTDNLTGFLKYTIRGGIVDSITNNPDENSVTVMMDNRLDGQLTITMSKDAITAFDDGSYFVTIDGEENHDFVQIGQRLTIDFLAGSEEIMIFGISDNYVSEKAAAEKAAAEKAAAEKAAALPMSIAIENAIGSSTPGCEPDCFIPNAATVAVGGTVSFVNSDTAPHTSTSGTPAGGPDGVWDSSLVMPGSSYDTTISSAGTYDYFCMVHPWMTGTITAK